MDKLLQGRMKQGRVVIAPNSLYGQLLHSAPLPLYLANEEARMWCVYTSSLFGLGVHTGAHRGLK
jgi:hypothetical protein